MITVVHRLERVDAGRFASVHITTEYVYCSDCDMVIRRRFGFALVLLDSGNFSAYVMTVCTFKCN